jgi:hypothetical protein
MGVSADIDALPYVDEHAVEVHASPERTWEALAKVADRSFDSGAAGRFARVVGCEDTAPSGPRPLAVGSAIVGFHVAVAEPGALLAIAGRHRFSRYALVFHLDPLGDAVGQGGEGRTRLRAETRAEFPGLHGRAYRTMVIGTRAHVLVTRRLLRAAKARAERPEAR